MAVFTLALSESRMAVPEEARFQNQADTIVYRMQTDKVLDWKWLDQTEADGRLVIHMEENGIPFLYRGAWQPPGGREALVVLAQETAQSETNPTRVDLYSRPPSALENPGTTFQLELEGRRYRGTAVVLRTDTGYQSLTLLRDRQAEWESVLTLRWVFVGVVLGCIALLAVFSWWFSGRALRPVVESRRRQTEFVAAASHELRAPLAVIGTSVEALRYGVSDPDSLRFADAIARECRRTGRLVDDLLTLATVDAKNWSVHPAPIEVGELLREIKENFEAAAKAEGHSLRLEISAHALPLVSGDGQRLRQVLAVLVDNALRHSPAGGAVALRCRRDGRWVRLEVADSGPGIPDSHKEKVFQRFFRMDQSRSKKEHYGLGLPIAWEIVRLHKGRIHLEDTPGGGLTAVVRLPRPG